MRSSGTKLVLVLVGLALLLGITSWWYRYEAAHRASQFWGPEGSRLIAESEGFEAIDFGEQGGQILALGGIENAGERSDLSKARGQAHLRHAFLSDRNYVWDKPIKDDSIRWKWHLRFFEEGREARVLLSDDLTAIGKLSDDSGPVEMPNDWVVGFSCTPMTTSLQRYFEALDLVEPLAPTAASTSAE